MSQPPPPLVIEFFDTGYAAVPCPNSNFQQSRESVWVNAALTNWWCDDDALVTCAPIYAVWLYLLMPMDGWTRG